MSDRDQPKPTIEIEFTMLQLICRLVDDNGNCTQYGWTTMECNINNCPHKKGSLKPSEASEVLKHAE